MGKTIFSSCCYFICPSRSLIVNLIFHDGTMRVVTGKRLAGEIMFEFPDCMVCHADSFYIGNPIPSLNIDDKLRNGDTYFVLPLDYFSSCNVLSASTLATLGSNPRRTPVNFRNPIFQYIKGENGRVLIKVSPEFIINLLRRGNEDQENIITTTSPSDEEELDAMGTGKKKIEIKQIMKETSRMVTFSKRRKGLFKKASELESMIGARVAIVVFSPSGKPYTCGDVNTVIDDHFPPEIGSSGSRNLNVSSAIDDHLPQFEFSEIGSSGSTSFPSKNGLSVCGNMNVCADIETQFPQFHEIGSSGSTSFRSKNSLCDWLEKIEAEECGNLNELMLLKEQLEGTRDKLAEHSESFEALFM